MLKKILFLLVGLSISLSLLEGAFTLFFKIYEWSAHHPENQKVPAGKKLIKIMTIGESTTAVAADDGNHFLFSHTAYPVQLQEVLNSKDSPYFFVVYNKGIMSGTSNHILSEFEENLSFYKPDIVIAMMGMKDQKNTVENLLINHSPSWWNRSLSWLRSRNTYKFYCILKEYFLYEREIEDTTIVKQYDDISPDFKDRIQSKLEFYLDEPRFFNFPEKLRSHIEKELALAIYYGKTAQFKLCEESLHSIIKRYDIGFNILAHFLFRQNKNDQALEVLDQAIFSHPTDPWYHFAKGRHFVDSLKFDLADESLKKALKLKNNLYPAFYELARSLKFQGQHEKAIQLLLKNIPFEEYENNKELKYIETPYFNYRYDRSVIVSAYAEIGENLIELKRYAEAETYLYKSAALNPKRSFNILLLSKALRGQGKYEEEREVRETLLPDIERLAEYYELAKFYKEYGYQDKIPQLFLTAKEQIPMVARNYGTVFKLCQKFNSVLALMQYPTFDIEMVKIFAPIQSGIYFIDNEHIFDDGPPQKYFFEPRYPYRFNHYTKLGAKKVAENAARSIWEIIDNNPQRFSY